MALTVVKALLLLTVALVGLAGVSARELARNRRSSCDAIEMVIDMNSFITRDEYGTRCLCGALRRSGSYCRNKLTRESICRNCDLSSRPDGPQAEPLVGPSKPGYRSSAYDIEFHQLNGVDSSYFPENAGILVRTGGSGGIYDGQIICHMAAQSAHLDQLSIPTSRHLAQS